MFPLNIAEFSQVFNSANLIFYILFSLGNGVFLYFASAKSMLALQQSNYKNKRYIRWLLNPHTSYLSRLMLLCLLGFLFFLLLNICFVSLLGETVASYVGFSSYLLFMALYVSAERNINAKVPLKVTQRLMRLIVIYVLLFVVATFGLLTLLDYIAYIISDSVIGVERYALICVLPIVSPFILMVANTLVFPFEKIISKHYISVATAKLDNSSVIKIGITGSYGKTSVKEILRTILSQKYRVLSTPKSYNTPLGVALAVKKIDSTHDVFIAEMGARNRGDIKEITNIVKPTIGVLTGINNQHLESFKTIENIKDTKFELFLNLSANGKGFFSCDSLGSKELFDRFNGEKYLCGLDSESEKLVYATEIKTTGNGTTFNLNIREEEPISCITTLLGKHNISNICLASAVAYKLGLTPQEISLGISRIQSVEHRLELIPNNKNIVIIDDSYNANKDGVNASIKVLDGFNGRKIVLTPGLVELGREESQENYKLGTMLSSHADIVYIIGKHNAEMLLNGLLDGGKNREEIRFSKTLNKANEELNKELKEGDIVLFLNDLPDNYS